ncbi:hypothetical protein J3459_021566 [Metarhizium acridum]|nr:hypothetical protein J3459_021566 [Metarhizium acridum]
MSRIKTRILVISDTHATRPHPPPAPNEFEIADLVRVTTGYRDPLSARRTSSCTAATSQSAAPFPNPTYDSDPEVEQESRAVQDIVQDAQRDGVLYLTEGTYEFALENGALIRVYASQYTPTYGGWAFQYPDHHDFALPPGIDVAMTHGPPYGVLDEAGISKRLGQPHHAGCEYLFKAVANARPRIHCFGHIHEGWGAYRGTWLGRDEPGFSVPRPTKECVMDEAMSGPIQTLDGLRPMFAADTEGRSPEARQKLAHLSNQRGYHIDLTEQHTRVDPGKQTLFFNASIMDMRYRPSQLPWIIDMDLPNAENKQTSIHSTSR